MAIRDDGKGSGRPQGQPRHDLEPLLQQPEDGVVEVYKWIVLAISISSDFWLRWLVHEA
jgi:hypothetical protein